MGALRKLPDIPGGLKGQAVSRQQTLEQLTAFRQDTEYIRPGPRDVPEQCHPRIRGRLLEQSRE